MSIQKLTVKKVVICAVALLLAAVLTMCIKDFLALQNPTSALPTIVVRYDVDSGTPIIMPAKHVMRASYEWRFFNVVATDSTDSEELRNMEFGWMLPNEEMDFSFSYSASRVEVSIAYVENADTLPKEEDYVNLKSTGSVLLEPSGGAYYITDNNSFLTPQEPGMYIYRVQADWGLRGSVLYYFKINVPDIYS